MKTLIVVDVQNDFCPGGSLATDAGDNVAEGIAAIMDSYDIVLATQDWHVDPGDHFSTTPNFVTSWPVHCVAESHGADFHPAIPTAIIDATFRKGQYDSAYSGFEGSTEDGHTLAEYLRDNNITEVDVAGIATDHCVRATVKDALKEGFNVRVLAHLCSPVDGNKALEVLAELEELGAEIAVKH
ncbi:pyrazinamidase / nicotinamidase [Corynebacterium renale]|uniref:isochorismatase family protein n=1 Tax=Corynebacterium renale TaxID=1724 RepID=UPI000DA384E8|nr:isochorismatase family protein [Corynebacterium renale]SQG65284.1 pyrazinamidase / nicotinamidase [Corynebacterium renale]